jgi:predicted ATPase/class 3 adenylate cyclase
MYDNNSDADHLDHMSPLPDGGTLTFLFTDIEGSTELWEKYPGATRKAMARHDELVEEAVEIHHGLIVKPRGEGDSRFVVFPKAVDAMAAASVIQLSLQVENWLTPTPLRVRIGLHTGEAELHQDDYYGDAVNRCARIRGVGHGGQTLLSTRTAALVKDQLPEGSYLRDLGRHRLKGISQLEQIFQLIAPGLQVDFPPLKSLPAEIQLQPPTFLESRVESDPVKENLFVGRDVELEELDDFLVDALGGQGRVAFVVGDAGRGKSVLVQTFTKIAQKKNRDLVVAVGNCNAYTGTGDPYLPFREVMDLLTGNAESRWAAGAIDTSHARRLWQLAPITAQLLLNQGPDLVDVFIAGSPLVARMHTAGAQSTDWLTSLEALVARHASDQGQNIQQSDLFEQYTRVLQALATRKPLLLVLDDLQWGDSASIHLLFHLGRRLAGSQILVIGIYRPDEVAMGRDGERHPLEKVVNEFQRDFGEISVDLRQVEGRSFVDAIIDAEPNRLGDGFRTALFQHTKGHALFTTEMIQGLRERGDLVQNRQGQWVEGATLNWEILPARVEGVIGERIGRLPERFQDTLKIASVQGEIFTAEVIAQLQGIEEREMVTQLSSHLDRKYRLDRGQGSQRFGSQRLSQYRFQHILFQRYLYDCLDEIERQYLHEAVGNQLESLYGQHTDEVAIELALHFEEAGLAGKASEYLYQAGIRAVRLPANEEAISLFERGLSLLETLPETDERNRQELKLQIALFAPLAGTKGYGASEVGRAYTRARELCEKIDDPDQLFLVLYGLWGHNLVRSELQTSRTLAADCLALAEQTGKIGFLMEAHRMTDETAFYMGEIKRAHHHFERSIALYDPLAHGGHAEIYGQDPGVALLSHGCCILWHAGVPDQGLQRSQEAIALAKKQNHHFSLGFALCYSAMMHQYRREPATVRELTEAAIQLSHEHGFVIWQAQASFLQGWAMAEEGQMSEGIAQMSQSLADWRATGIEFLLAYSIALLAVAKAESGQLNEALELLEEAFAAVAEKDQGLYEAELYRLKGELLLKQGTADEETEHLFKQAIEIAGRRQTLSQELRAVMNLCHLWSRQGKSAEAHAMLSEIYNRFQEGFDTADLQEASELLQELAEGSM